MTEDDRLRPGDGDSGRHDQSVREFVERFALVMTDAGMPRMPARVLSCVLAEQSGCLTARQLRERLLVSPAAVSGAVRYLTGIGALTRERRPGERVDHYRFHDEQWFNMFAARDPVIARWGRTASEGAQLLGLDTAAGHRLAATADYFDFMRKELNNILLRWREHNAARTQQRSDGIERGEDHGDEDSAGIVGR